MSSELELSPRPSGGPLAAVRRIAIIPAFNEELNIGRLLDELRALDPELETVVVSDGSTDRTEEVAAERGAHVVRLPFNVGIGGAVQTGCRYAYERGYELIVRLDGDGQHDPAQLALLLAPVLAGEADIAIGSRFIDERGYQSSAARRFGIRVLALVVSAIARQRLTDTTSGFQALNRRAVALYAAELPHDYPEVEGLVIAVRHGLRIREVPRHDAGAGARPLLDRDARLGLLHDQGAARDIRRSLPPRGRRPGGRMTPLRISIGATAVSVVLLAVVFELIRSRRLRERYALLWLATGLVLIVLSAWRDGLNTLARWVGVRSYPPAVLFAVGLLFVIIVLLHYSTVISRLTDQNSVLAQRLALLENRIRELE